MAREGDHMDTIVVAMNGSEEAAASLEFAVKEAAIRGARLTTISGIMPRQSSPKRRRAQPN
jgi:nucleotide-binding universal stress UspA family protein